MPHNPQSLPGEETLLPDHRVLALSGRDAVVFAQAQFMNDVATLAIGHWQWNGWLTPKGRLIALFALLKLDDQTLWLLLPDADPTEVAIALQRFVFRSKVTLERRDDLVVSGRLSQPIRAAHAQFADFDGGIELDMGTEDSPRALRVGASAGSCRESSDCWAAFDIEHGLPRLPPSQAGQWTPQQLSLDRLRAYSVRKGCYPGQEIVARTHFLGQAKRGLLLFEADAPLTAGSEVGDGNRAIGTIVSSVGRLALAVAQLEREAGIALNAGGIALHERPVHDGLAR